jgi:hypothetical protein
MKTAPLQHKSNVSAAAGRGAGSKATAQLTAAAQFVKDIDIDYKYSCKKQKGDNLCWASVTEAFTNISQDMLMEEFTNKQDEMFDLKIVLNKYKLYDGELEGKPTWDGISKDLEGGPAVLVIGPKNNGHFVILNGCKGSGENDKSRFYRVSDPANGGTEEWSGKTFDKMNIIGWYCIK